MGQTREHGVSASMRPTGARRTPPWTRAVAEGILIRLRALTLGIIRPGLEGQLMAIGSRTPWSGSPCWRSPFRWSAAVAARRPGNPLVWIFCVIGISYGMTSAGEACASIWAADRPASPARRGADERPWHLGLGARTEAPDDLCPAAVRARHGPLPPRRMAARGLDDHCIDRRRLGLGAGTGPEPQHGLAELESSQEVAAERTVTGGAAGVGHGYPAAVRGWRRWWRMTDPGTAAARGVESSQLAPAGGTPADRARAIVLAVAPMEGTALHFHPTRLDRAGLLLVDGLRRRRCGRCWPRGSRTGWPTVPG